MKVRRGPLLLHLCDITVNKKLCFSSTATGRRRKGINAEQERSAIRVRRRRRETEDTNLSGVQDGDHLLYSCTDTHTQTHRGREKRKEDKSKKLFDPRRDASSCCASLSISNEGYG